MDKLVEDALQIQAQVLDLTERFNKPEIKDAYTRNDWFFTHLELVRMSVALKYIIPTFKRYASK